MSNIKKKANYHHFICHLRTLTPIHIGSGVEFSPLDYFYEKEKNRICLIDQSKLMVAIQNHSKDSKHFKAIIDDLTREVLDSVDNKRLNYSLDQFAKEELNIDPQEIVGDYISCRSLGQHKVNIGEFIHTAGRRYIPGSSIKGAMKTAFMYTQIKTSNKLFDELIKTINKIKGKKTADDSLYEKVFGRDPYHDLFRAIHVSDTEEIEERSVRKIASFDYATGPVLSTIFLETVYSSSPIEFTLKVNDKLASSVVLKKDKDLFMELRQACNEYAIDKLEFHIEQIEEQEIRTSVDLTKIKTFYKKLLKITQNAMDENKFLLQIGRGSGFFGTTVTLLLHNNSPTTLMTLRTRVGIGRRKKSWSYDERFPKTSIIELSRDNRPNNPLGWVMISYEER
ncbi:MAG: type III-A CRISPR-associated RAMP protein Csm5 [Candidatus Heimdallarchaeota archaeon]